MANCELCGKIAPLVRARVEGTELNVCAACGGYGKVLHVLRSRELPKKIRKKPSPPAIVESIVSEYSNRIRKAREKKGLTQEDFAKLVNEKVSVIKKLEHGEFEPSLDLAKKLEKLLHITLIEKREIEPAHTGKSKDEPLTIGDVLKFKKRS